MKKKYKQQILLAGIASALLFGVIIILSALFTTSIIRICAVIAFVVSAVVNYLLIKSILRKSQSDPL